MEAPMAHNSATSNDDDNSFQNFVKFGIAVTFLVFGYGPHYAYDRGSAVAWTLNGLAIVALLGLMAACRRYDTDDIVWFLRGMMSKPAAWGRNWRIRDENPFQVTPLTTITKFLRTLAGWLRTCAVTAWQWLSAVITEYRTDDQSDEPTHRENDE